MKYLARLIAALAGKQRSMFATPPAVVLGRGKRGSDNLAAALGRADAKKARAINYRRSKTVLLNCGKN